MKNKNIILILSFILMLTFTACSKADGTNNTAKENTVNSQYHISLYYPSEEYIVNGNEENKFDSLHSMGSNNISFLKDAIESLKEIPNYGDESESDKEYFSHFYPAIPENITINSVTVKDDIAYVDFSSENLNGGSLDEEIIISCVFKSLSSLTYENEKIISGVKFTVDGENAESLMGHFDISKIIEHEI